MEYRDQTTTVQALKDLVHALCLKKGWGVDGIQNPQHVAMAMTVEMSELLEHFQWLDPPQVTALLEGRDEKRREMIAEEYADVMIYGIELMQALKVDISGAIVRKLRIVQARESDEGELKHT